MRVHRNRHDSAFVVIPNAAARHSHLSLAARGLLVTLLSLPDNTRVTVDTVTDSVEEGRRAVSKAFRQLEEAGYLSRRRFQTDSGTWSTETHVADLPTDRFPTVGEPESRNAGDSPKGVKNQEKNLLPAPQPSSEAEVTSATVAEEEGETRDKHEPPADAETGKAASTLAHLADADRRLKLSTSEVLRLAPLAAAWLAEGHSPAKIVSALTTRLPEKVDSAAALISYRLKNQMPAKPQPKPKPAPDTRSRCEGCRAVFPLGRTGRLCGSCRDETNPAATRSSLALPPAAGTPPEPSAISPQAAELLAAIRQRRDTGVVVNGKKRRPALATA